MCPPLLRGVRPDLWGREQYLSDLLSSRKMAEEGEFVLLTSHQPQPCHIADHRDTNLFVLPSLKVQPCFTMPGCSPEMDLCVRRCLGAAWCPTGITFSSACSWKAWEFAPQTVDLLLAWTSKAPLKPMATAERKGERGPKRHEGRDLWQNWASIYLLFCSICFLWCCPGNLPVSASQMVGL